MPDARPTVSVVVPVHDGGEAFRACAAALARALGPADELVVVADGETDGAWRNLPAMPCAVQTLVRPTAGGPAAARNDGARAASGDVLFFVDADVVVPETAVARVRAAFADPATSALIGSYCDRPAAPAFLSQYRNLLHHYAHQTAPDPVPTFWGACGAVRRDAFWAVGGFDAAAYARPSIEDVELGYRLTAAGHTVRLDKGLQVTHLKAWPAGRMLHTDLFQRAAPWTELLLRTGRTERQPSVDARSRASVALVGSLGLALAAALARPRVALPAAAVAAAGFAAVNLDFYRFLQERRGSRFALRAVPWHAAYAACSGLGFALGAARHLSRRALP